MKIQIQYDEIIIIETPNNVFELRAYKNQFGKDDFEYW